eukprot:Sspe_Gene.64749::Locus_38355_Transcript_1_2_Confidence_0.333_Length_2800::g.64749::m.64749
MTSHLDFYDFRVARRWQAWERRNMQCALHAMSSSADQCRTLGDWEGCRPVKRATKKRFFPIQASSFNPCTPTWPTGSNPVLTTSATDWRQVVPSSTGIKCFTAPSKKIFPETWDWRMQEAATEKPATLRKVGEVQRTAAPYINTRPRTPREAADSLR